MSAHNINARLETFCDGVIAIAITLLILEIKVPPVDEIHSPAELKHALLHHWPSWFGFILSFSSILISWANHHTFFRYLDKSSTLFVYVNGFFLLTIVIMPFTTALMAEYVNTPYAKTGIIVYCFNALIHNIAWLALFRSAIGKKRPLAKSDVAHKKLTDGIKQTFSGFVLYVAFCILAFWYPVLALFLITLSWIAWIIVGIFFTDHDI